MSSGESTGKETRVPAPMAANDDGIAIAVHSGTGILLTNPDGEPCRFLDYGPAPRQSLPAVEGQPDFITSDSIYELESEHDVRWKDSISGFLVHVAGRVIGRDAQNQTSVVFRRPGSKELLDLGSDAFAPMVPDDRNAVNHGRMALKKLLGVVSVDPPQKLGVLYVWSDERATYKAVLSPRPYERRPESVIVLTDSEWHSISEALMNFFGEETADSFCLRLSSHRPDPDSAGELRKGVEQSHGPLPFPRWLGGLSRRIRR